MAIFYVFQGSTYKEEFEGGYVWSPKLTICGRKFIGYTTMTMIKQGDYILHNKLGKIVAISIARSDCYDAKKPSEFTSSKSALNWIDEGYKVDVDYMFFDKPLITSTYRKWLIDNYTKKSAFMINGCGRKQYMCELDDMHSFFLINEAIKLQKSKDLVQCLNAAILDFQTQSEDDYTFLEKQLIGSLTNTVMHESKQLTSTMETQETYYSSVFGNEVPIRNTSNALCALSKARYLCEYNTDDRTFTRKNGINYTELHHLIPLRDYKQFKYSFDVVENIVS